MSVRKSRKPVKTGNAMAHSRECSDENRNGTIRKHKPRTPYPVNTLTQDEEFEVADGSPAPGLSHAKVRAKRDQARQAEAKDRFSKKHDPTSDSELFQETQTSDEATSTGVDDDATIADRPLTAEELEYQRERAARIWKRLDEEIKNRLSKFTELDALAKEPSYVVVCYGAALLLSRESALDAYGAASQQQYAKDWIHQCHERFRQKHQRLVAYNDWVIVHRPELADDKLIDLAAGSKQDRTKAKVLLDELDKRYGLRKPGISNGAAPSGTMPLIYQKEFQGKIRACPEWVVRVLRKVAKKFPHQVPAMASVFAQLAYWMKPDDDTGRPRAKRTKLIRGKWWIVLGYKTIEKQTSASLTQARTAIGNLKTLNLIETMTTDEADVESETGGVNFGPNTVFLRVNTEILDPLVKKVMSE